MRDQVLLAREGQPRLGQRRLSRRQIGLRGLQRVLLVLRIKPSDDLAGGEHIAHVDRPGDHAAVKPECEIDLVLGADLPGQRNGLPFNCPFHGRRPDRPGRRDGVVLRLVAARKERRNQRYGQDPMAEHGHALS